MNLEHFYSQKEAVEKALYEIVPPKKEPFEVYGISAEFLARGGKRFRPLLTLSCCRLCGGAGEDAMAAAAAIELFHNFTLIHDDIEDDSQMRRAQPCMHIKYGLPLAINAGDGLFMMVWKAALGIKSKNAPAAQKILLGAFTSVLEGQAMELSWHKHNRWGITEADYLRMAGGKTASLISACCQAGALLGGADEKKQDALREFGHKIGLAFQIQDDWLNLCGEEKKYKKEIGGDICEGKRTLMVLHCLPKLSPADAQKMRKILGQAGASQQQISWCIEKMRATGSLDYAAQYAKKLTEDATASLKIFANTQEKNSLLAVAKYIIDREE
ncbi:MAG: polyprenyl synthetase family protein [Candidatus Micrarchaeota archaeon]